MAEIVLSVLLPVVFEKLASEALNKFAARSKETHSELKKWDTSLRQIRTLLNDASQKEITDESVKDWLNRLQHLAYDIDDVLDGLATDAMHRELTDAAAAGGITSKVKKLIIPTCCTTTTFSSSNNTEMHHKLNEISTRLQELYNEKNNLGLNVIADRRSQNVNRKYQTSLLPPDIVGREAEKEFLLRKLLADDEPKVNQNNFSIVPIVGMGGIGKTTLARLLYNEPKVKEHFELKSWVCVSDEFDSFNISKVIFQSVAGEEKKEKKFTDPNLLQEALRNQLAGKRVLLVLDDVWSERIDDWDTLVPPFHAVAPGSKIVITTRTTQLIQQLRYANPYRLNKLSDDDALSLFAHYANNFDSNPTLRPHGEAIVKKCNGLPLALKALGRLLSTKTHEEEWKELLDNEIWRLEDSAGILPALRLSYLDLSARLKQLFAYTCLFPKDYEFEKEDLIWLWMAEGFLHKSTENESIEKMERLGEKFFNELLSRSFFEYVDKDKSSFVMHDLMNELATSVAGEFFVRLDIDMKNKIEEHSLEKFRRMSFVRDKFMTCKKFKAFERANRLRTFLAVPVVVRNSWESFYFSKKILVDLLPHLPLLRVLCLSALQIDEVPESVGDLKHLRYLNLSKTQITHLPEKVCNLYNLQTLIVFGCDRLRKLPDSFLKLKNLRHFDIRDTRLLDDMPLGIGELKSLQTLSKIVIGGVNEFPISGLKNLKNHRRRVCIHGLDNLQNNEQAREANLSQMRLSELMVKWSNVFDGSRNQRLEKEVLGVLKPHRENLKNLEILSYGGTEFPKWVADPLFIRLTDVSIDNCINCVFLPPLGQLPSLKKLYIGRMGDVKEVGSEFLGTGPAFPSLEILRFNAMPRWEVWSINGCAVDAVFPCLKELDISKCPNLVKISVEALPLLRVLRVRSCGEGVLKSLVGVASSVTKLSLWGISGLSDEVWGGVVEYLGAVEELEIRNCNEIRNLWESEEEEACKEVLLNLKKLKIYNCHELVRIGGGGGVEKEEEGSNLLPTSLRMLEIFNCKNLKHLSCPDSIETLDINYCENLEHLSCPDSIETLDINYCENLKHLSCPDSIEKLDIWHCKNLEYLSCPANSIQELWIYGCSSIKSVSFPTGEGGGGGWQKLKSLEIGGRNGEVFEKELEKQVLKNNTSIPPMLQVLHIDGWENLKSIMELNCLIQLTRLEIEDCGRIESFPDLQNLTSLKHVVIRNCESMDGPPPLTRSGGVSVGVWPPKLRSLEIGKLKRPISEWGPLPTSSLVQLRLYGGFGGSSSSAEEEEEDDVKSFPTSSLLIPYSLSSSLTKLVLLDFKKMERISSEGLQHLLTSSPPSNIL